MTRDDNNCLILTTREWMLSGLALGGSLIVAVVITVNAFASVRMEVQDLKEGQARVETLDKVVRDVQLNQREIIANQRHIIDLVRKQDTRIVKLEDEVHGD